MKKVVLTVGLPASGKSTWAKQFCKDNPGWKRVNKDDLRSMIDDGMWSDANEKFILKARDAMILAALNAGYNVIVDDTNLHSKHKNHLWRLVGEGTVVETKDFTDIDVEECIKRDKTRQNSVGEAVIRRMYDQFMIGKITRPKTNVTAQLTKFVKQQEKQQEITRPMRVHNTHLPAAIICDIDGTLALRGDRGPFDFHLSGDDFVSEEVRVILTVVWQAKIAKIIILTGREDRYKEQTLGWLEKHKIPYDEFYMRKTDDHRNDAIVKKEIYEDHIEKRFDILFVIDDRKRVKQMWVENGIFVFDVNQTDAIF